MPSHRSIVVTVAGTAVRENRAMDDALAYLAITRLQNTYADIATRMAWPEMRTIALPDAVFTFDLRMGEVIELDGPEALAAFGARACASFAFYNYLPLNSVVTVTSDSSATGRFYSLEVGVDRTSGAWVEFYGRYDDRYANADGEWKFAGRAFQTMARRVDGDTTTFETTDPT